MDLFAIYQSAGAFMLAEETKKPKVQVIINPGPDGLGFHKEKKYLESL